MYNENMSKEHGDNIGRHMAQVLGSWNPPHKDIMEQLSTDRNIMLCKQIL